MDAEVVSDLLEGHPLGPVLGDLDDVVTELLRIRLGHFDICPSRPASASQLRCPLPARQSRASSCLDVGVVCSAGDKVSRGGV